jgi:hypothetical protein
MGDQVRSAKGTSNHFFIIPLFTGIILFYAWLASAGTGGTSGVTTYYYSYLAEAFLNGNLHLPWQPDPHLLAMEDPYDPVARAELDKLDILTPVDFSLYEGKFYLYWGPVPALLLAPIQFFLHKQPVDDSFMAFAFGIGLFLVQSMLIFTIWDCCFNSLPKWILRLSILMSGLIWPVVLLRSYLDHARVYHAAITAGQFFLVSGLLMTFTVIARPTTSHWRLAFAGLLWALAIGSRHLLIVPIFLICVITTLWIIRAGGGFGRKAIRVAYLGLPLLAGIVSLSWYNWARFGSITETGFSYELAGVDLRNHSTEIFSSVNIIQNLYTYLFNAPAIKSVFPFVSMLPRSQIVDLPFYAGPKFYYTEPMTGLLYLFPFVVFAMIPLLRLVSDLFKRNSEIHSLESRGRELISWVSLSLIVSCFAAFVLVMFFFWSGLRYIGDFLPFLIILSVIGFWQGYQFSANSSLTKSLYILPGILLACISMIISTLLAISTT